MRKTQKGPACAIAFANGKGGCGRTTLIANLSVKAASSKASVALLDYDPQQSLARWHELRYQLHGQDFNPRLVPADDPANVEVSRLKKQGTEWIMLETPPATWHLIEEGVSACDFVVIPVKASPVDLEAIDPIIEVCKDLRKPFAFVLTMFDKNWSLSQSAFPYLDKKAPGHVLEKVLGYRQAYVGAMIGGATGPEYNKDKKQADVAADEIDLLWTAVKKRALAAVRT